MPDTAQEIFVIFFSSIFIGFILAGFVIAVLQLNRRKRMIQQKELENLKTASEKQLLEARLDVQEEVFKNVAMEIHDNIGQMMLLININNSLVQSMTLPDEAMDLVKENKTMLRKTMEDISQLSRSMHSDRVTDLGVFGAISHELELLNKKGVIRTTFANETQEHEQDLPRIVNLVLFRMYQEIMKNIMKHARATEVNCTIGDTRDGLTMEIKDNGIGFDTSLMDTEGLNGIGLRSLHTRVATIKGKLVINSTPGKGTCVSIFIPEEELHHHE